MTRTAIRHALSALAAMALASGAATAQTQIDPPSLQLNAGPVDTTSSKQKTSKALATQKPSRQTPATHYQFRWFQDYGGGK